MKPTLRPYRETDAEGCLELFRSNIPRFFAPHEEGEFADFLAREALPDCDYFVIEDGPTLLGCGGVYVMGSVAGLCWGLVDTTRHRQGIGSVLLRGRLEHLGASYPGVSEVRLDTSQHSQGFFARFGFNVTRITPDAYAPGLDRYDMTLAKEAFAPRADTADS